MLQPKRLISRLNPFPLFTVKPMLVVVLRLIIIVVLLLVHSCIYAQSVEDFLELAKYYKPKGSPALYKFECLHCHEVLYGLDQC